jgi:NTE family protein
VTCFDRRMTGKGRGLVLGGGGVTGVAWEIGLLHGLAERGVDLTGADLTVGTSAGSVVAAQLLSGVPLADLYAAQLTPPTGEIAARLRVGSVLKYVVAGLWPGGPAAGRAWLGRQALKARTVPEAERRDVIAGRLRTDAWPDADLLVTAVQAETGSFTVFDRSSGVSLIDAVHASCAVPLTWPPATVNGVRYIDGGMRSVANVDLARGCDRVVVIAPIGSSIRAAGRPAVQAARLEVPHVVIAPTESASRKMGRNPLDPAFRAAAAEAGRQQAGSESEKISEVWKQK